MPFFGSYRQTELRIKASVIKSVSNDSVYSVGIDLTLAGIALNIVSSNYIVADWHRVSGRLCLGSDGAYPAPLLVIFG